MIIYLHGGDDASPTRSRHAARRRPPLLPAGPVPGRDRSHPRHQSVQRLADAHRGAAPGHRRDPDQRPGGPRPRARGRAARDLRAQRGARRPHPQRAGPAHGRRRRLAGRPPAPRRAQGLDDRRALVGPRPPVDGLRDHCRARAPPGHAGPARRRPLLDQQRDQRTGAGARARRPPRRRIPLPPRPSDARERHLARRAGRRAVDHRRPRRRQERRHRLHRHRHPDPRLVVGDPRLAQPRPGRAPTSSGRTSRSETSLPATTTPRARRSAASSTTASSASASRTCSRSPTSSASPPGRAKAPGVLGALRGRIIDSLVCDEALARSVLSAAGSGTTEGTHP